MSQHLQGDKVNLISIQEKTRRSLINLLKKCDGPKAIIWDKCLEAPMGLISTYSQLKENGVYKMFSTEQNPVHLTATAKHIIFITRPDLFQVDLISKHIINYSKTNERSASTKEFHIIFVPTQSLLCQKHLESTGVLGSVTIESLDCWLFPIESDVLSMELNNSYRDYHVDRDPTMLFQSAQALDYIQKTFGPIPSVFCKGDAAKTVWDLTKKFASEDPKRSKTTTGAIDQVLLIDRNIDLITPLATQLTYEGLIDELFGIKCTSVKLPADKFPTSEENTSKFAVDDVKEVILNSSSDLFADLRDKNFNAVGPTLSKQARLMAVQLDARHADKTLQEMSQFVAKLPALMANKQALATHTTIAECIKAVTDTPIFVDTLQTEQDFFNCVDTDKICPFIEELIAQQASLPKILRLICLQCQTNSGLKSKVMEFYKRELIQVYGIETLLTLTNLEKAGLLYVQTTSRHYSVLRKSLHLTMEDTSETDPTDISYVHSVYAPLSIRLAENLCKPRGWKLLQDVLGLLPGATHEEKQPTGLSVNSTQSTSLFTRRNSFSSENSSMENNKVILVFFIGGCTYAEISALRFLSQQEDVNCEFIVATTKLINGNTFVQSLMENVQ